MDARTPEYAPGPTVYNDGWLLVVALNRSSIFNAPNMTNLSLDRRNPAHDGPTWSRIAAALASGAMAIILNTAALKLADAIHLPTARGGLLRLTSIGISAIVRALGIDDSIGPLPTSGAFQLGFHLFVGILMALFYAFVVEPRLRMNPWAKGLACALAVWLLNALVVLPVTGEGFAGRAHLSAAGMVWYGCAHTLFFVLLAALYAALRRPMGRLQPLRTRCDGPCTAGPA